MPDASKAFLGSYFELLSPRPVGLGVLSPEGFNVLFRQHAGSP